MILMAKDKKPKADRHTRKAINLRLNPILEEALDLFVEQQATNRNQEITNAIREWLAKHGHWPPKPKE